MYRLGVRKPLNKGGELSLYVTECRSSVEDFMFSVIGQIEGDSLWLGVNGEDRMFYLEKAGGGNGGGYGGARIKIRTMTGDRILWGPWCSRAGVFNRAMGLDPTDPETTLRNPSWIVDVGPSMGVSAPKAEGWLHGRAIGAEWTTENSEFRLRITEEAEDLDDDLGGAHLAVVAVKAVNHGQPHDLRSKWGWRMEVNGCEIAMDLRMRPLDLDSPGGRQVGPWAFRLKPGWEGSAEIQALIDAGIVSEGETLCRVSENYFGAEEGVVQTAMAQLMYRLGEGPIATCNSEAEWIVSASHGFFADKVSEEERKKEGKEAAWLERVEPRKYNGWDAEGELRHLCKLEGLEEVLTSVETIDVEIPIPPSGKTEEAEQKWILVNLFHLVARDQDCFRSPFVGTELEGVGALVEREVKAFLVAHAKDLGSYHDMEHRRELAQMRAALARLKGWTFWQEFLPLFEATRLWT